ncbi:MAG: hypothetical protein WKG00_19360 [Polyangiaceae bacterium]
MTVERSKRGGWAMAATERAGLPRAFTWPEAASSARRVAPALLGLLLAACSKSPSEPEPPAAASAHEPAFAPLVWDAPPTWTLLPGAKAPKKATYKVPATGGDKEDAEVNVVFFGTGAEGDPERRFKEMFGQFDGDVGATARRESFEVHGWRVETVDAAGTFKMNLTPEVGPKKRSPVQMVKKDHRLQAAVVRTPDRGNWFFRMTGPDATVQAATGSFRAMIDSVR